MAERKKTEKENEVNKKNELFQKKKPIASSAEPPVARDRKRKT